MVSDLDPKRAFGHRIHYAPARPLDPSFLVSPVLGFQLWLTFGDLC
jgi:hypothetical protein